MSPRGAMSGVPCSAMTRIGTGSWPPCQGEWGRDLTPDRGHRLLAMNSGDMGLAQECAKCGAQSRINYLLVNA